MGTAIFGTGNNLGAGFSTNSVTRFGGLFGSASDSVTVATATEAEVNGAFSVAGTLSNYFVNVRTNSRTTNTVFQPRLNGANTAISITYTSGQSGSKSDTSNTATVAQDDLLCTSITTLTGGSSINTSGSGIRFVPNSGTVGSVFGAFSGTTLSGTGPLTDFIAFGGRMIPSGLVETDSNINIPQAGTASYMQMYVNTNGRSTSTVVTFRKNAANGNQTFTYTSGQTGLKKDTSNTDSISANDKVVCQVALGAGTGNFTITMAGFHIAATTSGQSLIAAVRSSNLLTGATQYVTAAGPTNTDASTEANTQMALGTACVGSKAWFWVLSNAATTAATFVSRINGADGNQVVTVTALTTGSFQDTTHSDTFAATDLINYKGTGGATGTVVHTANSMLLFVADPAGVGTVALDIAVAGVGVAYRNSIGSVALDIAVAGVGASTAASVGVIGLAIAVAGVGVTYRNSVGTIGLDIAVAGAGASIAASVGTIAIDIAVAGVGASIVAGAGSIALNIAVSGVGAAASASVGAVTLDIAVSGAGAAAARAVGTIALDISVSGVTAVAANSVGTIGLAIAVSGAGVTGRAADGVISLAIDVAGSGVTGKASVGSILLDIAASGVGASVAAAVGTITLNIGVTGAAIPTYSTDVIVCVVMSGDDVVAIFCTLAPPAVEDVVSLVPMSDADVVAVMVLCCTC